MKTFSWVYKGIAYTSTTIDRVCTHCLEDAVIALPAPILAEQPDETTHVCHPLAGGCNQGFSLEGETHWLCAIDNG